MKLPHLVETMDCDWPPASLQATMREILECCTTPPFRPYNISLAARIKQLVLQNGYSTVVELGAGSAPISRILAADPDVESVRIVISDSHPDPVAYRELADTYAGRIIAHDNPVDFTKAQNWLPNTLLVISGSFHHVPPGKRAEAIRNLTGSADCVVIAEPLRKNLASILLALMSFGPGLLCPLLLRKRAGRWRRYFWCWLLPVAPILLTWDGLISCLRMNSTIQWKDLLCVALHKEIPLTVEHDLFSQIVTWRGRNDAATGIATDPNDQRRTCELAGVF